MHRHLRFGWWSLLLFGAAGLVLESFHGFKVGLYLDVGNDTRRLMWTLAHAHGTLLALVHLAWAMTVRTVDLRMANLAVVSRALTLASVLLPGGFFLGGIRFYSGDPGVGILLVPVGAVCLLYAAASTARALGARQDSDDTARGSKPKTK